MGLKVKVLIECDHYDPKTWVNCTHTVEAVVNLVERTENSDCGCCSHSTGHLYVDKASDLPAGWSEYYGGYRCLEHFLKE